MATSPHQEIFTVCRKLATTVAGEGNAYDHLPADGAAYPFVFVGNQSSIDKVNKSLIMGEVTQILHVYHDQMRKRGTLSAIMDGMIAEARKLQSTANYNVRIVRLNQQVLIDQSTNQALLHGVIEITFEFIHK